MDRSPSGSSVHGISKQEYWSGLPCLSPLLEYSYNAVLVSAVQKSEKSVICIHTSSLFLDFLPIGHHGELNRVSCHIQ